MYKQNEIANKIFYVGVNDRQKALFENLWPLPQGVSYNSYLIVDEKTALVDTVDVCYSDTFLKKIAEILDGRPLDYLIVNHMEPDHAGAIRLLRVQYPDVKIVGNKRTFDMLQGYHGINTNLHEVTEGEELNLGSRTLTFFMAPMVHWPEVMFTYDDSTSVLFSADAFGTFGTLDGAVMDGQMNTDRYWSEMERYYANIVGKYGTAVQKALQKLATVDVKIVCSTHGPVWCNEIARAASIYDRFSRYEGEDGVVIAYGSMYGNTEQMAEAVASELGANGIRNIAMHNVSKSHASYILRDVFKYKAVIIGSPTYSNTLFPEISSLLSKIEVREVKNRLFGCFGSFTWSGAAVRNLTAFCEKMKWEMVGSPVEEKQALKDDKYQACLALGKAMADRIKNLATPI